MLLIGSRAAKFHLTDFRSPLDWDFIASEPELKRFYDHPELKPVGNHDGVKRDFSFGRTFVEVEIATTGSSCEALFHEHEGATKTPFGTARVASLDALFLLKRSHVAFQRMWLKHFRDYRVLQEHVGSIPARLEPTLALRIKETKKRLRFRDKNFSISNDEFFGRSADRVMRVVPHDSIHDAIKFGPVPLFKLLKEDQNVATVLFSRFLELPFDSKIKNMQEECMVLTIERHAIPARLGRKPFVEKLASEIILREMCFNYLPFDFRLFAVDYFDAILRTLPRGYSVRAMDALGVCEPPKCENEDSSRVSARDDSAVAGVDGA